MTVTSPAWVSPLKPDFEFPTVKRTVRPSYLDDQPAFGYSAVRAVSEWRFEAPKFSGKPAWARVRVPFVFKRKDSGNTDT